MRLLIAGERRMLWGGMGNEDKNGDAVRVAVKKKKEKKTRGIELEKRNRAEVRRGGEEIVLYRDEVETVLCWITIPCLAGCRLHAQKI